MFLLSVIVISATHSTNIKHKFSYYVKQGSQSWQTLHGYFVCKVLVCLVQVGLHHHVNLDLKF